MPFLIPLTFLPTIMPWMIHVLLSLPTLHLLHGHYSIVVSEVTGVVCGFLLLRQLQIYLKRMWFLTSCPLLNSLRPHSNLFSLIGGHWFLGYWGASWYAASYAVIVMLFIFFIIIIWFVIQLTLPNLFLLQAVVAVCVRQCLTTIWLDLSHRWPDVA